MNCSKCQNELKPGAQICGNCGTLVSASAPVHVLACLACGSPLAPGATVCGKCGASTAIDDASNMTVILPRKSSPSLATPAPPPVLDSADGATVILSAGRAAKPAEPVNNLSTPSMRLPERSVQPEMTARAPSLSMALERERQNDDEEAEKKGKTVLVAIGSATLALVLIAVATGLYVTRGSAPTTAPVEASAPLAEPQLAPVMVEQSLPVPATTPVDAASVPAFVQTPAVAPSETIPAQAPIVSPPSDVAKPAAKPVRKLSEEEEYLRQIRRQLGR